MKKEHVIEQIDQYLLGRLSGKEKEQFLQKIETEPEWKTLLEEQKLVHSAINRSALRDDIDQIHQEMNEEVSLPKKAKKINLRWMYGVAAAVAIFFIAGYWVSQKNQTPSLYDQYFYKDAGLPITMSGNKVTYAEAMNHYKQGQYVTAEDQFSQLLNEQKNNDTLQYYVAMSALNQDKFNQAEKQLYPIIKNGSPFRSDALFFLALIQIKQEQLDSAKLYLQDCQHPKAKELLDHLP